MHGFMDDATITYTYHDKLAQLEYLREFIAHADRNTK